MLPSSIYCIAVPQAQHSTAQRNKPAQRRKSSTCRSECENASKQTESIYCTRHCSTASTAQHRANSPNKAVNQVRADQRTKTQASRQRASIYCIAVHTAKHSTVERNQPVQSRKCPYVPIRAPKRKQAHREHVLYCSTLSTAQHRSVSPHKASNKYVPIRVSQRKHADRVGESQHMWSSILKHVDFSKRAKNSKSARRQIYATT